MFFSRFTPFLNRARAHGPFLRSASYVFFGIITWMPALIFFNSHIGEVSWVHGASMYPYLNTDFDRSLKQDACLNIKWKPAQGLQRGMIVTFWSPLHPDVQVVKRVIALEGDKVYTRAPYPFPVAEVPGGHVWVEGDGGNGGRRSLDSNTYGPISKSLITGRITHVLWPWSSFGGIDIDIPNGKLGVIQANGGSTLGDLFSYGIRQCRESSGSSPGSYCNADCGKAADWIISRAMLL